MAIDFLAHLRSESARFRDVLARTDPAARVPPCPEWSAADLLWHLAEVQHFWGVIVRDKLDDPELAEQPERAAGHDALLAQFDEANAILVQALDGTAADVPVWTWYEPDRSVGFVRRRQAHEALIHRVDAELTSGQPTRIDSALAHDGVLEVLERMYGSVPSWAQHEQRGPVGRIATTDTGGDWLVQLGRLSGQSPNTGTTYENEPTLTIIERGEPSFEVRGTAADLDCWLWNRPSKEVHVAGDADEFLELISSGVQ